MNKTELIAAVAEKSGLSKKDSEAAVVATIAAITDALKAEDKVQIVGFGSFEVKKKAAHMGRNPRTGETMKIAASKNLTFKAGKALKDAVAELAAKILGAGAFAPASFFEGVSLYATGQVPDGIPS